MEKNVFVLSRNPHLVDELRCRLTASYQLVVGQTLTAARKLMQGDRVHAVLAHLSKETLNGHTPGQFFGELQEAANRAPIYGLVDPDCPPRLKNLAGNVIEACVPLPADYTRLADLLDRPSSDPPELPAAMSAMPYKELRAGDRSLLTFTPSMFDTLAELEVAARHDVTVLLIGETGSGKTHLARLLHDLSPRRQERFCPVACGALPPDLIESELFGYVKGAFTGAERDKPGKFCATGRGTLLLDEIDVLPLAQQAKLLRILETGEYEPVGSNETLVSRARLIVASNLELEELVEVGRFRSDLYFRLNVLSFHLPPLRERPLDIEYLARSFVAAHCRQHDVPPLGIGLDFIDALRAYDWPGNVRELENIVRRAVLYCREDVLTADDLPRRLQLGPQPEPAGTTVAANGDRSLESRIDSYEQRLIQETLARNNQRRGATAKELGISRVTLYNKMKKFGMLN